MENWRSGEVEKVEKVEKWRSGEVEKRSGEVEKVEKVEKWRSEEVPVSTSTLFDFLHFLVMEKWKRLEDVVEKCTHSRLPLSPPPPTPS